MNIQEIKITVFVCILFFLRIFSLSILTTSFGLQGLKYEDSNIFLIGLAIGSYGVTQSIFQIIFGLLSDKFGRTIILIVGLFLFSLGNVFLVLTDSIWDVIIGRSLQGSGAISSILITLLSDIVQTKNFSKSMMFVGFTVIFSFFIAFIFSPIIFLYININLLFLIILFITILYIIVILFFLKKFKKSDVLKKRMKIKKKSFFSILFNFKLVFLNLGTFFLYFTLTSIFLELPKKMKILNFIPFFQFETYIIIVVFSMFLCGFLINFFKRNSFLVEIFILLIIFLIISNVIFFNFIKNKKLILVAIQLFFISFITFSSCLPSLINQESNNSYKGTILSIYYTFQSLGSSLGGIITAWFQLNYFISPFLINVYINVFWLFFSFYFFKKYKYNKKY
ncbi:MFS transporter [Buchnera aphidicola (Mindarus keteleerifoliae)]|uniref:MFS transporter n=1 Tax=Buchnera aphidicola TaxID=9 RepID=UPI0031B6E634